MRRGPGSFQLDRTHLTLIFLLVAFGRLVMSADSQPNGLVNGDDTLAGSRTAPGVSVDENYDDNDDVDQIDKDVQVTYIDRAFTNRQTFTCSRAPAIFTTGHNVASLAPENIDVVAVMGDALSTGLGLYPESKYLNFRGASFISGGDEHTEGLVTIAQVLSVFNPRLIGMSHGIGTADALPRSQLNVAKDGAESDNMPEQAQELIIRLRERYTTAELHEHWVLIFMTIGSEEICIRCEEPNMIALQRSLFLLWRSIPRALVVLVGPLHIAHSSRKTYNLLKAHSNEELRAMRRVWTTQLSTLEAEFARLNYTTFGVLAVPTLRVVSQHPEQLFFTDRSLLNRLGHMYAAKWLWNRMIAGWKYHTSKIPISENTYYCPSVFCPFFKTPANRKYCGSSTYQQQALQSAHQPSAGMTNDEVLARLRGARALIANHWLASTAVLAALATSSVFAIGTVFYLHGRYATKGRFEQTQGV